MRLTATVAACAFFQMLAPAPTMAEEVLPECSQETVGIQCVAMRDTIGSWQLQEVIPPVGTQNALQMSTSSFEPVLGIFGRVEPADFVLTCIENTTSLEVKFGENFMSDVGDFAQLVYKIDDQPPVAIITEASNDNAALGIYNGLEAIPIIRSMFEGERLLVSAQSFTGRALTSSFSIAEIETAVEPLRSLCNW